MLQCVAVRVPVDPVIHASSNQSILKLAEIMATATHCTTLHHTATHCNTLQHSEPYCNTLQHTTRRDLKLENFLLADTGTDLAVVRVVIADFGACVYVRVCVCVFVISWCVYV